MNLYKNQLHYSITMIIRERYSTMLHHHNTTYKINQTKIKVAEEKRIRFNNLFQFYLSFWQCIHIQ